GLPMEVQIRTELQATWADTYEKFADVFGRPLRYLTSAELERFAKPSDASETAQVQAMAAQTALMLQQASTGTIAELEILLPVLAVADADLDKTITVEGIDINLRALRESVDSQRQNLLRKLQEALTTLQSLNSESSSLRWDT